MKEPGVDADAGAGAGADTGYTGYSFRNFELRFYFGLSFMLRNPESGFQLERPFGGSKL